MTNDNTTQADTLPPLYSTILQAIGQHAGTAASALLAAWGVSQPGQATQIESVVGSLVILAGSLAWTFVMHQIHHTKAEAAVQTAAVTGTIPK